MTQNNKFTFQNLDPEHGVQDGSLLSKPRKRVYTDEQIKEIYDDAHAKGVSFGEQITLSGIEEKALESLELLCRQHSVILSEFEQKVDLLRAECADLSLLIAKKLASALIDIQPMEELEKLFTACVPHLNSEPRIVIRVDESQIDFLRDKIEKLSRMAGYPGRIVIIGLPDALPAQCQIEWADGGVSYRSPEQLELIDQIIADYVAASNAQLAQDNSVPKTHDANPLVMDNIQ